MRLPEEESEQLGEINIVPMIDVIFAILTFFIISSLNLNRSASLPVNLPSAQTVEVKQETQISVTVEADGDLFVDRQPTQLDNLKSTLGSLIQPGSESLVVINADKSVEHGQVVKVMDLLRQVPGARLAIAATQE
ncbi:biopolymer transporter ExbD [Aphanothece hegewaldii CCALA 016]|uniref:Biopolymer transporter ExbD n=1 Tax=Aphanothece hegewaldii CCALA 016 TaxID=2107694 RepID=A0A2T1LU87_9CHRO|nr:biopolymer transporter ExbD [Aphanothece hegewaldii]PSF35024.1 biopolymer transporter ExbD [Aphanothece hegewaldii CCALA 016]